MTTDLHVDLTQDLPRPVEHVFHAIVDPVRMQAYFITRASGPMVAGTTVTWWFDDVGAQLEVTVTEVEPRRIAFSWAATGAPSYVVIELAPKDPDASREKSGRRFDGDVEIRRQPRHAGRDHSLGAEDVPARTEATEDGGEINERRGDVCWHDRASSSS